MSGSCRDGPAVLVRLFSGDRETDRCMHDCLWLAMPVVSGEHPADACTRPSAVTTPRLPLQGDPHVSESPCRPSGEGSAAGLLTPFGACHLGWRLCGCRPGALRPLSVLPFLLFPSLSPLPLPHVCSTPSQAGRAPGGPHLCAPDSRSPVTEKALIGLQGSVYVVGRRETGCWVLRTTDTVCPGLLRQGGRAHSGVRAHVSWAGVCAN